MPWRPPTAGEGDRDARLKPYRERGGRLFRRDGTPVGVVYLQTEIYWRRAGGLLGWRRWAEPRELPYGHLTFADGSRTEFRSDGAELERDLAEWARGDFRLRGEVLTVCWLDDEASLDLRQEMGFSPSDS